MAKRVLGNDPFQKGAAARAPRPAAEDQEKTSSDPKQAAAGSKGRESDSRKKQAPQGKKAGAQAASASAKKGSKASAEGARGSRPAKAPPPRQSPRPQPASPQAPAPHAPSADAQRTEAREPTPVSPTPGDAPLAETLKELEATLEAPVATGPMAVPGFEDEEAEAAQAWTVEVQATNKESRVPEEEVEDEAEAEGPDEPERALVPPEPSAGPTSEAFFTSESPGAEPHRMGTRFTGLLSLAREVAFQALASEQLGRTVSSAQGLLGATLTGLGVGGGTAVDEYGKDGALAGVLQPVLDFLYERYWRVSVQGASHVPSGPVLLVANHSGALPLDGPVLQQSLTRERPDLQEARWLAEDQVFHAPMLGTLMNRLGAVRACPENALRLLDELRPLIVFPEGIQGMGKPFAQRYQLKRFGRGGFVKLALRTGAPIVPVAIVGAEETAPLIAKIPAGFLGIPYLPLTSPPLPVRWIIRFGEPIGVGDVPPEAADDLSEVQRLTERTRESIQGMLQALLKERRSVFAG